MSDDYAHWEANATGDGGVLRYDKHLTKAQQRFHVSHELIHAANDYHYRQILNGGIP